MKAYLRILKKGILWTELVSDVGHDCKLDYIFDVADQKTGGTSYWLVDPTDKDEVRRALAAYITSQTQVVGLMIGFLPYEDAKALEVKASKSKSKVSDESFGDEHHFDLTIPTISAALSIVNAVRKSAQPYSVDQVYGLLKWSVEQGFVRMDKIPVKLLETLGKSGRLKLA